MRPPILPLILTRPTCRSSSTGRRTEQAMLTCYSPQDGMNARLFPGRACARWSRDFN
jgi:hypothetical protein